MFVGSEKKLFLFYILSLTYTRFSVIIGKCLAYCQIEERNAVFFVVTIIDSTQRIFELVASQSSNKRFKESKNTCFVKNEK